MADTPKPISNQTKVVETADGTVRITQPKGVKHRGVTVLLDTDDVLREQVGGFANFLREYAVVGLAVGFVVGQQAGNVAKALLASFLDPWVKILFGQDLSSRAAHLHHGTSIVLVPWGSFVYACIEFVIVLVFIYAIIKIFNLNRLKKLDKSKA